MESTVLAPKKFHCEAKKIWQRLLPVNENVRTAVYNVVEEGRFRRIEVWKRPAASILQSNFPASREVC